MRKQGKVLFANRIIRYGFINGKWEAVAVAFTAYALPSKNKRMLPLLTARMD